MEILEVDGAHVVAGGGSHTADQGEDHGECEGEFHWGDGVAWWAGWSQANGGNGFGLLVGEQVVFFRQAKRVRHYFQMRGVWKASRHR